MRVWLKENRDDVAVKMILFILSPFFALLFSLRTIKTRSSYTVFFLFSLFFGLSFTVSNVRDELNTLDGVSYRQEFESYRHVSQTQFFADLKEYLTFEEGSKDFYFDTVAFYVSRFSDNYHVMFMAVAIVFAYFGLKSFKFLTSEENFRTSLSCFILVYLFMINQIFNINGLRFWTAAWIAVYCIFQIFRNHNKRYFLLALFTPFFHGSFWIFLLILLFAYVAKVSPKVWVPLFFTSFFVSNVSVDFVRGVINSLPPFIAGMAQSYTDAETIKERAAAGSGFYWVAEGAQFLVRAYINLLVWLFIKNIKQISSNPKSSGLFSFLLVWMAFVNFTMPIPSLGSRFMYLAFPVISYIWLVNFKGFRYQKVLYAMPLIFLFSFYSQIRLYAEVLDPFFYFSSPFYLIYNYIFLY